VNARSAGDLPSPSRPSLAPEEAFLDVPGEGVPAEGAAEGAAGGARVGSAARPALRLLLVEDDPSDAELIQESLADAPGPRFKTTRVARLSDAVLHLRTSGADVVLVDLNLPDSRGLESATRLLEEAPGVALVVMTGFEDETVAIQAVQHGAQDFLLKGRIDGEVLARALRYAVERRTMLSRLERAAAEARANESNLRNVISRSVEGIVVLDADGRVRFANPAAGRLFSRDVTDLQDAFPWHEAVPGAPDEVTVARPDGSTLPAEMRTTELEWEQAPALLVSLHDLTDRKRGERVRLVRDVQRAFQPERTTSEAGGVRMAGLNELCEDASGDYYDFLDLPDGRVACVVGDVSGHGLEAALVMAQGRACLRALFRTVGDLSEVVEHLNEALAGDLTRGRFMTLFLATLDRASGRMDWLNAGHQPALLFRGRTGEIEGLPATGLVLGVVGGAEYPPGPPVTLGHEDVLLAYSDGATEARSPDGVLFGEERVARALERRGRSAPSEIIDGLRADLLEWTGGRPLKDDLTLIAVSRVAPARARRARARPA
jgi:serine phosphatase RsbU (regulator of sigma subunit)/DNA-binding NarL/FixJ family response regulator